MGLFMGSGATAKTPTAIPAAASNLVGYWKFDEGAGTTVSDSSGNGNNGSIVGGPSWVQGHSGSALQFDGVDDHVDIPDSPSLDVRRITIEAWVKPDVNDQLANIVSKWKGGSPGQRSYNLDLGSSNPPSFYPRKAASCTSTDGEGDTEVHLVGTSDIPVGVWTHIAATYDGSVMKIYVNGQLESSLPQTGDIFAGTARLFIADADDGTSLLFDGAIDEVKIYDRALTAGEIQAQVGTAPQPSVGGIAELPDPPEAPREVAASSSGRSSAWAAVAGVAFVATGAVLLAASAWYARRREDG